MIAPYTFVFVSHVSEDSAAATAIVGKLEARGIACWIAPRDVNPGRPFDTEIADAIETCRVMLLLFSEGCNESEYIRREVTVAGEVGKVIIPYRIEEARPKGALRVRLSDLHWIDAFEAPDRAFDELVCTMLPDGRSETSLPIVSELTTSTSVILPEAVPAQEAAPAAQTETERIDAEIRANNYVDMDVTSDSAAEEAPLVTSPPFAPLVSQVSPAHVSAEGTVERIEQPRRRRAPPTGPYLARPARAAARQALFPRLLLEWLRRRPIHAAGVIALSVLTSVGTYTVALPSSDPPAITAPEVQEVAPVWSDLGYFPPHGGTAATPASSVFASPNSVTLFNPRPTYPLAEADAPAADKRATAAEKAWPSLGKAPEKPKAAVPAEPKAAPPAVQTVRVKAGGLYQKPDFQ